MTDYIYDRLIWATTKASEVQPRIAESMRVAMRSDTEA